MNEKEIIHPEYNDFLANYKLLLGSVLPRPIAFVSTISEDGVLNLAPFSFFTAVSANPPMICFAPMLRFGDSQPKDTLVNIQDNREFVVNVVSEDIVAAMNETAPEFPAAVDEFERAGLTPADSLKIRPPRVAESPVNLECKLYKIDHFGKRHAGGGSLVVGEVVAFHIRQDLLKDGKIDSGLLRPVARLAGPEYTTIAGAFAMKRKTVE